MFTRVLNTGFSKIMLYPGQKIARCAIVEGTNLVNAILDDHENANFNEKKANEKYKIGERKRKIEEDKEFITKKVRLEESCLSDWAKNELIKIIGDNFEAFVGKNGEIGKFKGSITHKIELIDENKIVQQRPYRVTP